MREQSDRASGPQVFPTTDLYVMLWCVNKTYELFLKPKAEHATFSCNIYFSWFFDWSKFFWEYAVVDNACITYGKVLILT